MKKASLLLILLLTLSTAEAQQAERWKMSRLVRQAVSDGYRWRSGAGVRGNEIPGRTRGTAADIRRLTAFVSIDQSRADEVLQRYGCRSLARWGDITIADIPLGSLAGLSAEQSVRRIEASGPASLQSDTTAIVVNAQPVYEATATHQAYTGEGVVVGLVDVGIDLTHPNFYDQAGERYRIAAFWDQLSADTIGSRMPVGRDYVGTEAIRGVGGSTDSKTLNHGTHTAGIAVGSGYDTRYRGVAFGSDLCLVANALSSNIEYIDSASLYKYTTATDALAFKYCLDYAESQGRPCVVSLSEGYAPYLDQEDSLYAAVLDSLTGPGRIIVAAAGNGGGEKSYFEKSADSEAAGAFVRCFRKSAIYRIKADGPVRVTLYRYGEAGLAATDTLTFETGEVPLDTLLSKQVAFGEDSLQLSAYRDRSRFGDDDIWQVLVKGSRTLDQLMPMALVVTGPGAAEVYGSTTFAFKDDAADGRWTAARRGRDINAPSCFPALISVGATAHRLTIADPQGRLLDTDYSGTVPGTVWYYSSTGLSMNGLTKPDVTAPGTNVVSSYSHYYHREDHVVGTSTFNGQQYHWGADSGTSMSAPVVAGVIALWLQARPDLTPDDIRGVMSRCCRHPEAGMDYPNATYGYGEIDAYRGLLDILGLSGVEAISQHQPKGVEMKPTAGSLQLSFDRTVDDNIYIKVYSLDGRCVFDSLQRVDGRQASVPLPMAVTGVHVVQLSEADGRKLGSCLVRLGF